MQLEDYVPEAGDIVWLNFDPQKGHEQAGRRPALVLSDSRYNRITKLMICCPMTTHVKGYPFEVVVPDQDCPSVVLSDHIKNQDWKARRAEFKQRAPAAVLSAVRAQIVSLIGCEWLLQDVNPRQ